MYKVLNILVITLAVLEIGQDVAAQIVPHKPTFEILFVKDLVAYLKNNPDVQLKIFNYNEKEGFTFGKKWDNNLFNLEYKLENFRDDSFVDKRSYTYPQDVIVDIQHIQLFYKDSTNQGNVFLKEGGIGQTFASLLVEVPDTNEPYLTCYVKVTGDVYDVIN